MKNVAFVLGPALGHVSRSAMIAEELARGGDCEITVLSPDNGKHKHVDWLVGDRFRTVKLPADTRELAQVLRRLTASEGFDLMVFDLHAQKWLEHYGRPEVPSAFLTNVFLTRAAGLRTRQIEVMEQRRQQALREGATDLPDADAEYARYEMDRVLLIDPVPLIDRYRPLPPSYRACGAVAWGLDGDLPEPLRDARDVLLVSMGSTGRRPLPSGMIDDIVKATGCTAVVVVGTRIEAVANCSVPVLHFSQLAMRPLLPRTRVALSSGGAGSTYLALEAGLPTVVWPTLRNQEILGEIIEDMGLGLLAREDRNVGDSLAAGFEDMRSAARRFAPAASSKAGVQAAASELREMMA